jgi:hypothetical protein
MAARHGNKDLLAVARYNGTAGSFPAAARIETRPVRIQLSDLKADSCITSSATLPQTTKMKAMCKRRRSSEMLLDFLRNLNI